MGFKDLMNTAESLTGKAEVLTTMAADTASKYLDEFNQALPTIRALGFTIKDFHMSMGIVPEVSAKLIASVDAIDVAKINELASRCEDKKLLLAVLKALETAYQIRKQIGEGSFKSVEMDLTLGIPPHVSVGFVSAAASSSTAAAA